MAGTPLSLHSLLTLSEYLFDPLSDCIFIHAPVVSALVVWFADHFLHRSLFFLLCQHDCVTVCSSVALPPLPVSQLVRSLYSYAADFSDPYTCQPSFSTVQFPLQQQGLWTDGTWRFTHKKKPKDRATIRHTPDHTGLNAPTRRDHTYHKSSHAYRCIDLHDQMQATVLCEAEMGIWRKEKLATIDYLYI